MSYLNNVWKRGDRGITGRANGEALIGMVLQGNDLSAPFGSAPWQSDTASGLEGLVAGGRGRLEGAGGSESTAEKAEANVVAQDCIVGEGHAMSNGAEVQGGVST